jgi:predicted transcriptional regulator
MEDSLLDLIFLSEKRKNVLLLLLEGPKDIETMRKALNASATSVQPQVKKLKEQHLVVQEKDLYKLSEIGKIVAEKMKPLIDIIDVLEENVDYWADRNMSEIPPFLLRRIGEFGHCTVIEPQIDHLFEMIPEYVKNAEMAKKLEVVMPYFHPLFPSFFLGIAKKDVPIFLILPESVLKRWIEDYKEETKQFLEIEKSKLFVCTECEKLPAIAAADNFMALALFPRNAVFDRKYILNFNSQALKWAKELYDYYEQRSKQIHNIDNYTEKS